MKIAKKEKLFYANKHEKDFLELFDNTNIVSYQPADPRGLILWDVDYGDEIDFELDLKSVERMRVYFHNQDIKYGLKKKLYSVLQQNDFSN